MFMFKIICKFLRMQRLISDFQETLNDLWFLTVFKEDRLMLVRDLDPDKTGSYKEVVSALYSFNKFVRNEHPEVFEEWLKVRKDYMNGDYAKRSQDAADANPQHTV